MDADENAEDQEDKQDANFHLVEIDPRFAGTWSPLGSRKVRALVYNQHEQDKQASADRETEEPISLQKDQGIARDSKRYGAQKDEGCRNAKPPLFLRPTMSLF